jgi:hypothetical protein
MLWTEIIVREFLEGVRGGIVNNIRTKHVTKYGPIRNTGETEKSIFWRYDGKNAIVGSTKGWITVLEDGRPPGKFPPPDSIEKYVSDKLLPDGKSQKSLAFLIGRKISEKGSLIYQQGGHSGILSDYINEEYIRENLTEKLKEKFVTTAIEILFK